MKATGQAHVSSPRWTVRQAVTWRILAELLRRHPGEGLRIVESHPAGGLYDCLSLWDRGFERHYCDFKLGSANFHKFIDAGEPVERLSIGHGYVKAFLDAPDPRVVVGEVERALGFTDPTEGPQTSAGVACLRAIAGWLGVLALERGEFEARSAMGDDDGHSFVCSWVSRVPHVSEYLKDDTPDRWKRAMRYWRLAERDAPTGEGVIFDLRDGVAHGPKNQTTRVADLYAATKSVEVLVGHVAAMCV